MTKYLFILAQQSGRPGELRHRSFVSCSFLSSVKWIIIDAKVYDLSKFVNLHPGGAGVLLQLPALPQGVPEHDRGGGAADHHAVAGPVPGRVCAAALDGGHDEQWEYGSQ